VTDPDEDFAPPPQRRGLFHRLRRLAFCGLVLLGTIFLLVLLSRWQVGRVGAERLRAETARLDADDPGWKLDAILAERKKTEPPEADNAATAVLAIADQIPEPWLKWRYSEDANKWWARRQDNRLPPAEPTEIARKYEAETNFARLDAIRLRDKRAGAFALVVKPDPLTTMLPHLDKSRQVLSLLQYDAYLAALDKKPNRGLLAARGALAVSRAIGDEPFLVSQLVRIASAVLAAQTAMQVLAWGEPTDGLAELQAELLAEADVPFFRIGMRGERAMLDRVFTGLADGSIPVEHWFSYANINNPGPEHYALFKTYRPLIPGDHAKALEICSKYIEAAKLPHHEQLAALKAVPIPPGPPDDFRYILTRLFIPASDKVAEAGLRARAELLAAATCIAAERFRSKHGRWPRDPAELVPALLPAVPSSPFDGKPISYRTFGDRVAVYFFWADAPRKVDDLPDDFREGDLKGAAYGYRLWNPAQRGLPPEEKKDP
jgi:hypothetical protein